MIRDEISVGVTNLVINEREYAIREHQYFHSDHEAYSVTLEEVEESEDELQKMKWRMTDIWEEVKNNCPITDDMRRLKGYAIQCACECIQVAAMCDKLLTDKND